MNTSEAARAVGVPPRRMLYWQQHGYLSPKSNGRDDQMRRLDWSEKDVEQAKALKDGESTKSPSEAVVDSLGGMGFLVHLEAGRSMQEKLMKDEVVIVGQRGSRVVKTISLVSNMISLVGLPMVVLPRESL